MAENKILRVSSDNSLALVQSEKMYFFIKLQGVNGKDVKAVFTPEGNYIKTSYSDLANRIFDELEIYHDTNAPEDSLLHYHIMMLDKFAKMSKEKTQDFFISEIEKTNDWLYNINDKAFSEIIGARQEHMPKINNWLSDCTHMQKNAVFCLVEKFESYNLAYIIALMLENFSGTELTNQLRTLATLVSKYHSSDSISKIIHCFEIFSEYYGIHLEEDGPIIKEKMNKTIPDNGFVNFKVNEEMLIGRNYYYCSDYTIDKNQPFIIENDLSFYEDEIKSDKENFENDESDYNPSDFEGSWIKRIKRDSEDESYWIICLKVENGIVSEIEVYLDEVLRVGNGIFFVPGMDSIGEHEYSCVEEDEYSDAIFEEIQKLKSGVYLPNNITFIGKPLPRSIIDKNGNSEDVTNYDCYIDSAYRQAYMHLCIKATENGIINHMDYSTYQSFGNAFVDMFSKPIGLNNDHREIIDTLLYLIDKYSFDEYTELFCKNKKTSFFDEKDILCDMLESAEKNNFFKIERFDSIQAINNIAWDLCGCILNKQTEFNAQNNEGFSVKCFWFGCYHAGMSVAYLWNKGYKWNDAESLLNHIMNGKPTDEIDEASFDLIGVKYNFYKEGGEDAKISHVLSLALAEILYKNKTQPGSFEQLSEIAMAAFHFGVIYELKRIGYIK